MAITFTWSVKDLHKVTETGAVYKAEWSCSGVDADTKVSHSRSGSYLHTKTVDVPEVTETVVLDTEKVDAVVTGQDDEGDDIIESITRAVTTTYTRVVQEAYTEIVSATPDHTASGFTAYADLTEADVLAWCKADGVGASNEVLITSNITNKIAAAANSTGMPWAAE